MTNPKAVPENPNKANSPQLEAVPEELDEVNELLVDLVWQLTDDYKLEELKDRVRRGNTKTNETRAALAAREERTRQATIKEVVERLEREEPEEYKAGYGTEGFDNANAQWRAALEKIEEEIL